VSVARCPPANLTGLSREQLAGVLGDRRPAGSASAAMSNAPTTPTRCWGTPAPPLGNCGGEADATKHALGLPFGGPVVGDTTSKPAPKSGKGKEHAAPVLIPASMLLVPTKAHGGPSPIPYCSKPLHTGTFAAAARRAKTFLFQQPPPA